MWQSVGGRRQQRQQRAGRCRVGSVCVWSGKKNRARARAPHAPKHANINSLRDGRLYSSYKWIGVSQLFECVCVCVCLSICFGRVYCEHIFALVHAKHAAFTNWFICVYVRSIFC